MISKILSPKVDRWSVAYALHNNFSKSLWRYKEIKNKNELKIPFLRNYKFRIKLFPIIILQKVF